MPCNGSHYIRRWYLSQFSTGLETAPELWDAKRGLSNGKSLHELKVNRELKELSKAIENHYARMVEHDGYVTAERVKNAVLGIAKEPTTLLKELEEATTEIEKSIGINHSIATYRSYVNAYMNLSRFIQTSTKRKICLSASWNTHLLRITIYT